MKTLPCPGSGRFFPPFSLPILPPFLNLTRVSIYLLFLFHLVEFLLGDFSFLIDNVTVLLSFFLTHAGIFLSPRSSRDFSMCVPDKFSDQRQKLGLSRFRFFSPRGMDTANRASLASPLFFRVLDAHLWRFFSR